MVKNKYYQYILVENSLFVNKDLPIFNIYLNLYRNAKPFSFFDRKIRKPFNILPNFIVRAIRISQFIKAFYSTKKNSKFETRIITNEHYGHVLLKLRQGEYKIFNFQKETVTTTYKSNISCSEIESKLQITNEASKCKLAPKVICWDINCSFITENFFNIKRSSYDLSDIEKIQFEVYPLIKEIITTTNPKTESFEWFYQNKLETLSKFIEDLKIQNKHSLNIENFISHLKENLQTNINQREILVVFSHGDLWEGNILINNNESRIIDWNTLDYRSCYFDFYYFMFMLTSKTSHFDKVDENKLLKLQQNIERSKKAFYNNLITDHEINLFNSIIGLNYSDEYRYLFYLELIVLKLSKSDNSSDTMTRLYEVNTWVNRFKLFEKYNALSILIK